MTAITVTSAIPLNTAQRQNIEQALDQKFKGETLQFEYITDPSVLGGIKLTIGSRELDGTLAARLQQVSASITENI